MHINKIHLTVITNLLLLLATPALWADENHIQQAINHAEAASVVKDVKMVGEHAGVARSHAKTADEHLDEGLKHLDSAVEHAAQGRGDMARKEASLAVGHLKLAQ